MASQKTLLLLGGARYALPIIDAAHKLGVRVITCDYLPHNYAHKFSDGYINASIIDKDAVLAAAKEIHADGIMSFAADPGVVAAAYTAEKLSLPFQGSYESVSILQSKDKFRTFLRDNNFNCPVIHIFSSVQEAKTMADSLTYPVIVKPVDSAGSKGVTKVTSPSDVLPAVEEALEHSFSKKCICEQFLQQVGFSSDSDSFTVNGLFDCISFTSQHFDSKVPNPYTPAAFTMPSQMPMWAQTELKGELQRLANLLHLQNGVYNIETRIAQDGKPYLMEVAPRGGGNRLCEMLRYASGVDLLKASVEAAMGLPVEGVHQPSYDGVWYQLMLHSTTDGIFKGVKYIQGFKEDHVAEEQLWVNPGNNIFSFTGANHAFGSVFMHFDTKQQLDEYLAAPEEFMQVEVESCKR